MAYGWYDRGMLLRDWEINALDLLGEPLDDLQEFFFVSRYLDRLPAHVCLHLHHVHQIVPDDLPVVAEAYDSGRLTQRHWDEIHDIDYLVAGLPFGPGPKDEVVMGIQVALRVDVGTVEDIARRVACFAACGAKVIAAVDGRYINPDAEQRAVELGVTVLVRKVQPAA